MNTPIPPRRAWLPVLAALWFAPVAQALDEIVFEDLPVRGAGGIPFYRWSIVSGALPPGLALDSFTGQITGVPTSLGTYTFAVGLAGYDRRTPPVEKPLSMLVTSTALRIVAVEKSGADVVVRFTSLAGGLFRVERSDDLSAGSWTIVTDNVPGTRGILSAPDPGAANAPRRFYRVTEL